MSLFNRFIESIIPAPDRDDDLMPGDQASPLRRSTRSVRYTRETEEALIGAHAAGYGRKGGKAKAGYHDNGQLGACPKQMSERTLTTTQKYA